jgi:hypothetical protein
MFSNGTEPYPNFAQVLASDDSYTLHPPEDKSVANYDNYCYLRCKNNTGSVISAKAELYYTKATVVSWPDFWEPMIVDVKDTTLNDIKDIQPGKIGVVERPFIWKKPPMPGTNDHYCFIGRLSTDATPNPKPPVDHPITMAEIMTTNLMFAQRNIAITTIGPGADGGYRTILNVPAGVTEGSKKYHLFFYSQNMTGWDVEITSSMTDSTGRKIGLAQTTIKNDDDIYCGQCLLEPGFMTEVTVYLYSKGNPLQPGAYTHIGLDYASYQNELPRIQQNNILDIAHHKRMMKLARIADNDIGALIKIGGYSSYIRPAI